MIEIDEEMEGWGTETAEGPKIWGGGNSNILCLSAFILFSIPAKSGWGAWPPGPPASGAPGKREQDIQWVGGEHLLGYSFMYVFVLVCTYGSVRSEAQENIWKKGSEKDTKHLCSSLYVLYPTFRTLQDCSSILQSMYVLQPAPLYCSPLAATTGWPTKLRQCICFENESHQRIIRNVKLIRWLLEVIKKPSVFRESS